MKTFNSKFLYSEGLNFLENNIFIYEILFIFLGCLIYTILNNFLTNKEIKMNKKTVNKEEKNKNKNSKIEYYKDIIKKANLNEQAFILLKSIGGVNSDDKNNDISPFKDSVFDLMKNTPLIKIPYLSKITGHNIYAKCEHLLPFTSKDRMMKNIFYHAILDGKINSKTVIYEGSSGSTCYSAAMISSIIGLKCKLVIPDDISTEKLGLLKTTNAELIVTKQCPFSNFTDNYVRLAKKLSNEDPNGYFIDQFANKYNWEIHLQETGPEIIEQCKQENIKIDAFFSGAGTGGTIGGISNSLKKLSTEPPKIILSDVTGSGLYSYVKNKVIFTNEETEANRKRYRYYTNIEGVGINFLTYNFTNAIIDDAVKVQDSNAIKLAKDVYLNDGIFVGGSTAVNFDAILQYSSKLKKGSNIITVIYDSGLKYINKLYTKN